MCANADADHEPDRHNNENDVDRLEVVVEVGNCHCRCCRRRWCGLGSRLTPAQHPAAVGDRVIGLPREELVLGDAHALRAGRPGVSGAADGDGVAAGLGAELGRREGPGSEQLDRAGLVVAVVTDA